MVDYNTPLSIRPGETGEILLPWSEVCMCMRVAGTVREVRMIDERNAQILNADGSNYSFPITIGEAGIFHGNLPGHFYFYGPLEV